MDFTAHQHLHVGTLDLLFGWWWCDRIDTGNSWFRHHSCIIEGKCNWRQRVISFASTVHLREDLVPLATCFLYLTRSKYLLHIIYKDRNLSGLTNSDSFQLNFLHVNASQNIFGWLFTGNERWMILLSHEMSTISSNFHQRYYSIIHHYMIPNTYENVSTPGYIHVRHYKQLYMVLTWGLEVSSISSSLKSSLMISFGEIGFFAGFLPRPGFLALIGLTLSSASSVLLFLCRPVFSFFTGSSQMFSLWSDASWTSKRSTEGSTFSLTLKSWPSLFFLSRGDLFNFGGEAFSCITSSFRTSRTIFL